jgi:RHS repeat-associated protein
MAKLTRIGKDYHFINPDGVLEIYPDPGDEVDHGGIIRNPGAFSEISKHGLMLKVTRWNPDSGGIVRFCFFPDVNGRFWPVKIIEDAAGIGVELGWDESGRLKGIRQTQEKRTIVFEHNSLGLISQIAFRFRDGRKSTLVRYEYDANGRLIAAYNAAGLVDRYEYNRDNFMVREIFKDGGIFQYKYDDKGRCIRTWGLDGYDLKVVRYLDHIGWSDVTDSRGSVTRYQWLPSGQVVLTQDALGGMSTTDYDDLGRIIKTTSPVGAIREFVYDDFGNKCEIKGASGQKTIFKFNHIHQPIEMSDPNGNSWKRKYDSANRLVSSSDPLGRAWLYEYDPSGNHSKIIDPNGAERHFRYSPEGALIGQTDWQGRWYGYKLDEMGRVTEAEKPDGGVHKVTLDALGNPISMVFPDGSLLFMRYDAGGNLSGSSSNGESFQEWTYGPCKRLRKFKDTSGAIQQYEWGSEPWQLNAVVNERGERHSFLYSAIGRIVQETDFSGRTIKYKRNASGDVVGVVSADGALTKIELDPDGRIIKKTAPDGKEKSYSYSPSGYLLSAENESTAIKYERDELGRIIKESQGDVVLERAFDSVGNLLSLKSSMYGKLDFQYDENGDWTRLDLNGAGTLLSSAGIHGENWRAFDEGAGISQEFDKKGQLVGQSVFANPERAQSGTQPDETILTGSAKARMQYAYGPAGELRAIKDSERGESKFRYDDAERLVGVSKNGSVSEEYAYGNGSAPTLIKMEAKPPSNLEYGPGGKLTRKGEYSFEHDANGRMARKSALQDGKPAQIWTYHWDAEDQLISVHRPDGAVWEYTYDALGRRISKKCGKDLVQYVWDGDNILHEIQEGRSQRTWIWDNSTMAPVATIAGGRNYLVLPDHLGSPNSLIESNGEVSRLGPFSAWGERLSEPDVSGCDLRFPGQWFDSESGLHYNRFRFYDPGTASYLSPDPLGIHGGSGLYEYAWNPINWIDPFGLCEIGTHIKDEIATTKLRNVNLKKGTAMLKEMGLTPVKNDRGGTSFVDKNGFTRVRYDLEGPNGPAHWHKFHRDEHGEVFRLNDQGYVRSSFAHPEDDQRKRETALHITAG